MNARLTWIGAFGVVLAGAAAFYWCRAERTGVSATPNASAKSAGTSAVEQQLVGGATAAPAESDRTLASNAALDAAAHAQEPAKDAHDHSTALAPTQQPLGDVWSTDTGVIASGIDADNPPDPDGFAVKYAGLDTTQLQGTLAAVESVIAWQQAGKFEDKSQALPAEAMQALERERQWLKAHAYP